MATPNYDSMPEYREALSERARGLDGLLEPLRSEALQLLGTVDFGVELKIERFGLIQTGSRLVMT